MVAKKLDEVKEWLEFENSRSSMLNSRKSQSQLDRDKKFAHYFKRKRTSNLAKYKEEAEKKIKEYEDII
jgi:hypothetical protein